MHDPPLLKVWYVWLCIHQGQGRVNKMQNVCISERDPVDPFMRLQT